MGHLAAPGGVVFQLLCSRRCRPCTTHTFSHPPAWSGFHRRGEGEHDPGESQLLIDIPTYDYDMEYSALKDFQTTNNKSQAVLDTLVQSLPKSQPETTPSFKDKLTILFQDIPGRLSRALAHFRHERTTLNSLISRHVEPEKLKETTDTDNSPDRDTRDVADYFGLARHCRISRTQSFRYATAKF